ncbi:cyclin-dependent kinase 6-like, putative, partial [Bodo saltans]
LGLQYLHSHSPPTMHRDIKPENILLSRGGRVKWCDFDSCSPDIADTVQVGTLGYEAPETLQDGYTEKVDLWSMGRVLLRIVQDSTPATTMTTAAIALRLKDPDWQPRDDFHLNEIPDAPLRDLIFHLLERNPEKRLDAFQALQHPALTPNFYNGSYRGSDNLFTEAVEKFRTHGIVIGDGGAEKSELHQFFQVMKNDGNKVSKEDQSTLQDLFKQIVYSRQQPSVEFLNKFYEKWADDSFLLVSPDALRKWKHQNTEAAAPSSVPSASFSSDNSSQALPTSPPEPHATPLSPPEGNRSMEFSRH